MKITDSVDFKIRTITVENATDIELDKYLDDLVTKVTQDQIRDGVYLIIRNSTLKHVTLPTVKFLTGGVNKTFSVFGDVTIKDANIAFLNACLMTEPAILRVQNSVITKILSVSSIDNPTSLRLSRSQVTCIENISDMVVSINECAAFPRTVTDYDGTHRFFGRGYVEYGIVKYHPILNLLLYTQNFGSSSNSIVRSLKQSLFRAKLDIIKAGFKREARF